MQRDQTLKRDGRCVLTGLPLHGVDVCHIFPFSRLNGSGTSKKCQPHHLMSRLGGRLEFFEMLGSFYGNNKLQTLKSLLYPEGLENIGIQDTRNSITLAKHAHGMWKHNLFALKPVNPSDDKKVLRIQFFWQPPKPPVAADGRFPIHRFLPILTEPYSTRGLDRVGDYRLYTADSIPIK